VEMIRATDMTTFSNSGVTSCQLLFPENSRSERMTITRVIVSPGARNPLHRHECSEQVWVALHGNGRLLLGDGKTMLFVAGDVVRFEDNEVHGFENTGDIEFEYLSVTSPPVNFRGAYAKQWQ
jgi:quercetin dioxygenase-like cupin family protein